MQQTGRANGAEVKWANLIQRAEETSFLARKCLVLESGNVSILRNVHGLLKIFVLGCVMLPTVRMISHNVRPSCIAVLVLRE